MNPETMRLFVAISIPEIVRRELARVPAALVRPAGAGRVRRVSPEQLHLTLKFLGNVPAEAAEEIKRALGDACSGAQPFRLTARGIGVFPEHGAPRILWAGLHCADESLVDLHARVEKALAGYAEKGGPEKFSPHVTLARLQGWHRRASEELLAVTREFGGSSFGEWRVGEIELVRSELSPSGSRYTTMAVMALAGAAR